MGAPAEDLRRIDHEPKRPSGALLDWRSRYEGILVVAYLDGKAVAGISGPWPGPTEQYALTWWDRPVPARQLELFDSLEAAQRRVEEWARRMRTIGLLGRAPANEPIDAEPVGASWIDRLGMLFSSGPKRRKPAPPAALPRLELDPRIGPLDDSALRGVHFAAYE